MAGKDFRLTAVLAVRDVASPVVKAFSARWQGLAKVVQSTSFSGFQRQMRLFNRSMQDVVENARGVSGMLAGPLAAAAGAVGFSLQQAVSHFAATGDGLDKMSARVGVSVEKLQEWSYAATQSGASQEILEDALKDFGKHMSEIDRGVDTTSGAATLFAHLGIQMRDTAGNMRSVESVFRDFADAIQRNTDPTLRASMAMAVFGENGRKLIPMLQGGSAGLDDMALKARELGVVMSQDAVNSASNLSTDLTNLQMAIGAVGTAIATRISPTISLMAQRLQGLVVANREAFSERFASVAERFAQALEQIDFEGIVGGLLTFSDYAIRAFNAVGGFNTVLYGMGALMAGKTVMAVVSLGSSVMTMIQTFGALATAARTVGVAMAGALGPVSLVIGGVAIAAGVVIANWDRIWPTIQAGASACVDFVGAAWDRMAGRFGAVVQAVLATAKAFFRGDFPNVLRGLDDVVKSVFNVIPDAWAKVSTEWYESVKNTVKKVGGAIRDFFTIGGHDGSTNATAQMPAMLPDQRMSGRIAVDVMAAGGASAALTDVSADGGLQIIGSVGRSERSAVYYGNMD